MPETGVNSVMLAPGSYPGTVGEGEVRVGPRGALRAAPGQNTQSEHDDCEYHLRPVGRQSGQSLRDSALSANHCEITAIAFSVSYLTLQILATR